MMTITSNALGNESELFSSLLGEITCLQELLQAIEESPFSVEEILGGIDGIQRDIVQLYRAARG